jgi:hypothetical protein
LRLQRRTQAEKLAFLGAGFAVGFLARRAVRSGLTGTQRGPAHAELGRVAADTTAAGAGRQPGDGAAGEGGEPAGHRLIPSSATVAAFVLGAALLVVSAEVYSSLVSPARAPIVPGHAELYVQDPSVLTDLSVRFPLGTGRQADSRVSVDVAFTSARQVPSVAWALVMTGDSCFAEHGRCIAGGREAGGAFLPQGARLVMARVGQPPFSANPRNSLVQIVYGTTKMDAAGGHQGASSLSGYIQAAVVADSGPNWDLTLPSYGRLPVSPLFDFPNRPGALDLAIPGTWHRPAAFEVNVSVGSPGNDSHHRVDVASPPLADPLFLRWQSGEAVRGVVQRTDLDAEARQQIIIFTLGAIVGAGAALLLGLFEWGLGGAFGFIAGQASRSWRAVRGKLGRADSRP